MHLYIFPNFSCTFFTRIYLQVAVTDLISERRYLKLNSLLII